jgi:hypothetical protein
LLLMTNANEAAASGAAASCSPVAVMALQCLQAIEPHTIYTSFYFSL